MVLEGIDYKRVFYYFEEISNIPRGSNYNHKISDYLKGFALQHGLEYIQDDALNIVLFANGSEGCEDLPPVILQGHMDMVCEKEWGIEHDFTKDGIRLRVEDGFVKAEGTTLGADDGIAIAYALAIISDKSIPRPPLEVVVTTDEEIGMVGAAHLDATPLKGRLLINIDSEEEGVLLTSCAGGLTSVCSYPLQRERLDGTAYKVTVRGLKGGHSGMDIDKNRTNANCLMGRIMMELEESSCWLADIHGGAKDNVIPREAECTLVWEDDVHVKEGIKKLGDLENKLTIELSKSEPAFHIEWEEIGKGTFSVLNKPSLQAVLHHLVIAPNGVQVMSSHIEGLVESSLNLGVVQMKDDVVSITHSIRSSIGSYKRFLSDKMKRLVMDVGGSYEVQGEYPEWEYREVSLLRDLSCRIFQELFHEPMETTAIHAGLECGVLSEKLNGLDMISIGPNMYDVHTPKERLDIKSTIRTFDFLLKLLEELCVRG